MLVPLFPQLAGFKVENLWRRGSRGSVRCTARLSRRLRAEESERIERLANASVDRTEVVHECEPEEVEEWHTRLLDALAGVGSAPRRRAAVGERKSRRLSRRAAAEPPRSTDPAA